MELSERAKQLRRDLADMPLNELVGVRRVVREAYQTRVYFAAEDDEAAAALREQLSQCDPETVMLLKSELEADETTLKPHAVEWLHAVLAEYVSG